MDIKNVDQLSLSVIEVFDYLHPNTRVKPTPMA